jgi:Fe2+ or Zn2+ uptake regulation protein
VSEPKEILDKLKTDGSRMTQVRRAVVEILCRHKGPISAAELITGLKRRSLEVNKTTVYRELHFLLGKRIVREVDLLEGMKRYEILDESDHHHHMICLKCRSIQCIEMGHDLDEIEAQILRSHDFKVLNHTLEFVGLCGRCRGS